MNFAVIPWSKNELNDYIFYSIDDRGEKVPTPTAAYLMQEEFKRLGHVIHTVDLFNDLMKVDFFLFYVLDWDWVKKITELGLEKRMVYCNAEPPTVSECNTPNGYETLKRYFAYILTWNPDWIDNRRIFLRNIPYFFDFQPSLISFEERKLITAISANKRSKWKDELYTERENSYRYFEEHYPDEFDFYGVGWENTNHPCYKGKIKDKKQIFHNYLFAICFENTRMDKNYITEKIWDCLNSQIVPIYAGAKNVKEYIPEDCFIDFYQFKSYDELADYLIHMSKEQYEKYLYSAKKLLENKKVVYLFSGEKYAQDILNAVSHRTEFSMHFYDKIYVRIYPVYLKLVSELKNFVKKLLKKA